jgi:hypothetical protein
LNVKKIVDGAILMDVLNAKMDSTNKINSV